MRSNRFQPLFVIASAALGSWIPASLSAQSVVYDNTNPANNQHAYHSSVDEYGDEINLVPGPRIATEFSLIYYANFSLSDGAIVRFYANDGDAVNGSFAPGKLLYQAPAFDIQKADETDPNNVIARTAIIPLGNSGMVLPDRLTFTVSFSGVDDVNKAGLMVYNPPIEGSSSYTDFWKKSGGVWSLQLLSDNTPANFAAKLTAVPEPGPLALAAAGAIGWLSLAAYRRYRV